MAFSWAHMAAGKTREQVLQEEAEKQAKAAAAQKIKDEEDRVCLLKNKNMKSECYAINNTSKKKA